MPTIAEFEGLKIEMFFRPHEHNMAHVHVYYEGKKSCSIALNTLEVIEGSLPSNKLSRAKEWCAIYKTQLNKMWKNGIIKQLPPLPPR
jgi:hypothetical protein